MKIEKLSDDFRFGSNASLLENRTVLFWGLNRANIKKTSLYKQFLDDGRNLSFSMDNKVLTVKNELLTQTHKDVVEALLILCDTSSTDAIHISHSSILTALQKNSKNVFWLDEILEELNNVNFRYFLKNENFDTVSATGFKILDNLSYDDVSGAIIFSFNASFLSLYAEGKVFDYAKYTPFIANLDHDISKQVVRWLLTYSNLQINIKNLLSIKLGLANVVTGSTINRYVVRLKKEDLSMFGIWVDGDNICIDRTKEIGFFDGVAVDKLRGTEKIKIKQSTLPFFDMN